MSIFGRWWKLFNSYPGDILIKEVAWKLTQAMRSNIFRLQAKYISSEVSSEHGRRVLGGRQRSDLPPFFIDSSNKGLYQGAMERYFSAAQKEKIIQQAELVCRRRFNLLGAEAEFGATGIDWHQDFRTGYRYDTGIQYFRKRFLPLLVAGSGSDNKVPWELSRLQFIIPLGQAYWLSGEDKYARQFVDIVEDWLEDNPLYYGIHWCSPMEVAIRAANLIWGIYFFDSYISREFYFRLISLLEWHGRFIWANLEKWIDTTGNHYLSNLAGLVYLGVFLQKPDWLDFACRELNEQIQLQVLDDGASFEASTGYHRLVLEFFFCSALLCRKNGIDLPESFWAKLKKMFLYSRHYLKPNGYAPQIGDNDSGRFHLLGNHPITYHSYLSAVGGVLFNDDDFQSSGGAEDVLWLFGPQALAEKQNMQPSKPAPTPTPTPLTFPDAGMYVMRRDTAYMIICCGQNGYYNKGSHAHNDKLSFELQFDGEDFIVDPGSYTYTAYPDERDLFRSTAYHNTVRVDGAEQNRIPADDVFRLEHDSRPRILKWQSDDGMDIFEGSHDGYCRLKYPVLHTRRIIFDKKSLTWEITDILDGEGKHLLEWYFHMGPKIEVDIGPPGSGITLKGGRRQLHIETELSANFQLVDGYYSAEYGCKQQAAFIHCPMEVNLPYSTTFLIKVKEDTSGKC